MSYLVFRGLLAASSFIFLNSIAQANLYAENRIIVKTFNDEKIQSFSENGLAVGVLSLERQLTADTFLVRYSTSLSPGEASEELLASGQFVWAQPDYLLKLAVMPETNLEIRWPMTLGNFFSKLNEQLAGDPPVKNPPALPPNYVADPDMSQVWGIEKIESKLAWNISGGSREIVVADIDTGVDYNHPDLMNNMWRNPNPTQGDLVGYDFGDNDASPFDDHGHGTHTSGTIGAVRGNGIGIAGVSGAVSIMALRFITASGVGSTSGAIQSIDYAAKNGARVISASWGGYASENGEDESENKALKEAIVRAGEADILFVAAAGNDGRDIDKVLMYPGSFKLPNVLTVASTTIKDTRSFFSNFGPTTVHVGAPGSNIFSTVPGGQYKMNSGTSMACPHVAGLAALILSLNPHFTAQQVKEIIMDTVDPIASLQGKIVTGGRINAKAALLRARSFGI